MWSGGLLLRWNAVELEWRASHKDHKLSVLVLNGWICCHSLGFPFANGGAYFPFTFDDFDLLMECKLVSKHLKQLGCRAARGKREQTVSEAQGGILPPPLWDTVSWWMDCPSAFACGAFYFTNSGDGLINSLTAVTELRSASRGSGTAPLALYHIPIVFFPIVPDGPSEPRESKGASRTYLWCSYEVEETGFEPVFTSLY